MFKSKLILFVLLFCYVFAFYIANISVSLLISIPLWGYAFINKIFFKEIVCVLNLPYIKNVCIGWFAIFSFALLFPFIYNTFDFSFLRVIGMQFIHLLAAIPVLSYLKYKRYTCTEVLRMFVWIFVVQTLIQCIVISDVTLGEIILYFNKFDKDKELEGILGSGIRGKALSAATTYHLSLVYGIGFIIYIKEFLSRKITLLNVIIGLLIFVGIFFAGRTGFVGVGIGLLAFFFSRKIRFWKKLKLFLYIGMTLIGIVWLMSYLLPEFYALLEKRVFPYAFEFIYSLDNSGKVETASTNQLIKMWTARDFNYIEFLIGSGKYTVNGSYYMKVDPGLLRHTLFMGVIGYAFLFYYQLLLLPVWKMRKEVCFYYSLILLYLFLMDFKGCTIGTNKFAFAVSLLLSYCYFQLSPPINRKNSYE